MVGKVVEEIAVEGFSEYMRMCVAQTTSVCVCVRFIQPSPGTVGPWRPQCVGVPATEAGKLPLAPSLHWDFPLLQPHVSA